MMIDRCACLKQVLEGNKEVLSKYCMEHKLLKKRLVKRG